MSTSGIPSFSNNPQDLSPLDLTDLAHSKPSGSDETTSQLAQEILGGESSGEVSILGKRFFSELEGRPSSELSRRTLKVKVDLEVNSGTSFQKEVEVTVGQAARVLGTTVVKATQMNLEGSLEGEVATELSNQWVAAAKDLAETHEMSQEALAQVEKDGFIAHLKEMGCPCEDPLAVYRDLNAAYAERESGVDYVGIRQGDVLFFTYEEDGERVIDVVNQSLSESGKSYPDRLGGGTFKSAWKRHRLGDPEKKLTPYLSIRVDDGVSIERATEISEKEERVLRGLREEAVGNGASSTNLQEPGLGRIQFRESDQAVGKFAGETYVGELYEYVAKIELSPLEKMKGVQQLASGLKALCQSGFHWRDAKLNNVGLVNEASSKFCFKFMDLSDGIYRKEIPLPDKRCLPEFNLKEMIPGGGGTWPYMPRHLLDRLVKAIENEDEKQYLQCADEMETFTYAVMLYQMVTEANHPFEFEYGTLFSSQSYGSVETKEVFLADLISTVSEVSKNEEIYDFWKEKAPSDLQGEVEGLIKSLTQLNLGENYTDQELKQYQRVWDEGIQKMINTLSEEEFRVAVEKYMLVEEGCKLIFGLDPSIFMFDDRPNVQSFNKKFQHYPLTSEEKVACTPRQGLFFSLGTSIPNIEEGNIPKELVDLADFIESTLDSNRPTPSPEEFVANLEELLPELLRLLEKE